MESIFGGYVFFEFLRLKSIFWPEHIFCKLRCIFKISDGIIESTLFSWLNFLETLGTFRGAETPSVNFCILIFELFSQWNIGLNFINFINFKT